MDKLKGKLGIRELIAISILLVGTKLSDDTPSILYDKMDNAAWMAPLIIGAILFIPLLLFLKVVTSYENKNLADIVILLFGRLTGFFILFILWIIAFLALTFESATHTSIISTMYFPKTPPLIIYAVLLIISAYGAKKGIVNIGSVAWSVLFYIKTSLMIGLILILSQGEFAFLFPLFGPGKWDVIRESFLHSALYADLIYLGFILPFMKSKHDFVKGTWMAFGIIIIELSLSLTGFMMLFDYMGIKLMSFPFHEAIRYIRIGFMTSIEMFFFPFWLLATFVRFSFYLYIIAVLFGSLFKIKQYEYAIPALAALIVCIGMIPEVPAFTMIFLREKFLFIASFIFISFPFLLWITAKLKGDLKHEKTDAS